MGTREGDFVARKDNMVGIQQGPCSSPAKVQGCSCSHGTNDDDVEGARVRFTGVKGSKHWSPSIPGLVFGSSAQIEGLKHQFSVHRPRNSNR